MRASEIAERALLGAILLDPARLAEVQPWLEPADFYAYRHGFVYTEMLALRDAEQTATARAVLDRIIPSAEARRQVDGPYLHTLMESCPHPSRAPIYGRMVLEASIQRRTTTRAEHLSYIAQSTAPADVVIDELGRDIRDWATELESTERRWQAAGPELAQSNEATLGVATARPSRIADHRAEIATVASLLADPNQMGQVCSWLNPGDFTRPDAQAIYTAISQVARAGEAVDPVVVVWEVIRYPQAMHGLEHETVGRLALSGVPGYATVSGRAVLQASLRRRAVAESSQLAAIGRHTAHRPEQLARRTRSSLARMTTDLARWKPATP